jgi:hypothetical protein
MQIGSKSSLVKYTIEEEMLKNTNVTCEQASSSCDVSAMSIKSESL